MTRLFAVAVVAQNLREFRPWLGVMVKAFRITDYSLISLTIEGSRAAAHWHAVIHSKITGVSVETELVDLLEVRDSAIAQYTEFFYPR